MKRLICAVSTLLLASLACQAGGPAAIPTLQASPFDSGRTAYGFFPLPPEPTTRSSLAHYQALGQHADVVLIQQNVPWQDFDPAWDSESQTITDMNNNMALARQNGMDVIFVVDGLNGLNRREFIGLPLGWEASFADSRVRAAYANFALRVLREFHPRCLGLASEINTYADAHPDDFENFVSLYQSIYDQIKAEAPDTQVFVTFQWEDLNNLIGPVEGQPQRFQPNWETVEAFEPRLDLWVISSYPFGAFQSAAEIPVDYYTPLLERTGKPLAVAEGGYISEPVASFEGSRQGQVDYLNAIHEQIGGRLIFWIYLILNDFDPESYNKWIRDHGGGTDIGGLGLFASVGLREQDGTPRPGLAVWDAFRAQK
jgi:hypothetical protein